MIHLRSRSKAAVALGQTVLATGIYFADQLVIPMNLTEAALVIEDNLINLDQSLIINGVSQQIPDFQDVINNLRNSAQNLIAVAGSFMVC